jgi:Acetyltransferase (GNAT) family
VAKPVHDDTRAAAVDRFLHFSFPDELQGFERSLLFSDSESVVVRRGHPRVFRMRALHFGADNTAGDMQVYLEASFAPAIQAAELAEPIQLVRFYPRIPRIGRGIGAARMEASFHEATARGSDVMWLGVWERNQRAIAYYRKWEFLEFGTHRFMLGKDLQWDILLARRVAP